MSKRVTDLTAEQLDELAREAWSASAQEALAKGLPVTGSYHGQRFRYHPDRRLEALGPVAALPESASPPVHENALDTKTRPKNLHMSNAPRRALDQLETGVAIFGVDQRLASYNAAFRSLWDFDADFLDQEPSVSALIDKLHMDRKLPAEQDFLRLKAQLQEAYGATEPKEHTWHLPDGRTMHVVATPDPEGVIYLFYNATRQFDLERRYDLLNRVLRETLDNLADAVVVFASDGHLRLHNPAFARMWRLSPQELSERPHIETITALCRPLHGDDAAWHALREAVSAIGSREPIAGQSKDVTAAWWITLPCRCPMAPGW